jgi:hypothetical protein
MSDKIITRNDQMKGYAGPARDLEPTPITARLQWVADLVCAILNAETIKRSTSMMKRPPGT